jgi:beta-glucosidase/6-phospho-beta-glucosidase/beta-galactosidase
MRTFAGAIALLVACSSTQAQPDAGDAGDGGPPGPAAVTFPAGFLWGSATAAFQVEALDTNTDWSAWAALPNKIENGDTPDPNGPDALNHIPDDIATLVSTNQNAYRFSVEWGRIYPTLDAFTNNTPDQTALDTYLNELAALHAAGITPMVTLQHFAFPSWLSDVTDPNDPQGWERPGIVDQFATFCSRIAGYFGSEVDWWITINEPLNLVVGGYVQGSFPPGLVLQVTRGLNVAMVEVRAHAACYDAIHQADIMDADGDGIPALVSYAAHMRTFHPSDPTQQADIDAANHVRYVFNDWFINAVTLGEWDPNVDGDTVPSDITIDPTLKGRADYLGVNYYSDTLVSASRGVIIPAPINAAIAEAYLPTPRPKTDFGWDIYPEGLGTVLDEVKPYALPVVITENGIADEGDVMRARFIAEHLYQAGWAIQRGLDLRGYFHWALVDNFEWANGFCPHFGLSSYDMTTKARTVRASAQTYASIIQTGTVKQADIDAMPPYGTPAVQCQ